MSDVDTFFKIEALSDRALAVLLHKTIGMPYLCDDGFVATRDQLLNHARQYQNHPLNIDNNTLIQSDIFGENAVYKTLQHFFLDPSGTYSEKVARLVASTQDQAAQPQSTSSSSTSNANGISEQALQRILDAQAKNAEKLQRENQEFLRRQAQEAQSAASTQKDDAAGDPLKDPKEMELSKLSTVEDASVFDRWMQDIELQLNARKPGFHADILDRLVRRESTTTSPRDRQLLTVLHAAIRKSLSAILLKQLEVAVKAKEIDDTPEGYIRELKRLVGYFGHSQTEREFTKLKNANWKKSGLSLLGFLAYVRDIASKCGEAMPPGPPTERTVREILIRNIDTKDPVIAQIVHTFVQHQAHEKEYTADALAEKCSRVMFTSDTGAEKQAEVFAATISSADDLALNATATKNEHSKLVRENQSLRDKLKNSEEKALWNGKGSGDKGGGGKGGGKNGYRGGGKGGNQRPAPYNSRFNNNHHNNRNQGDKHKTGKGDGKKGGGKQQKGGGKNNRNNSSSSSSSSNLNKYCRHCGDHFNHDPNRIGAWRSHNASECKWANNNNKSGR